MAGFLKAHGYEPGPTQRPVLAGGIVGILGTVPATAILIWCDALRVEADILGIQEAVVTVLGMLVMSLAGGAYGRIFQRAANDRRGGWLFGIAFGFLLWTGGAVMVLPLVGDGEAPAGTAAIGICLALLLWGASVGTLFPIIHGHLHKGADLLTNKPVVGPSAAAVGRQRFRR